MKKLMTMAGMLIIIGLMACSEKKDGDNEVVAQVVKQYYANIANGDFSNAQSLVSIKNAKAFDQEVFMHKVITNEMRKRGGYKSMDILNIEYTVDHKQAKVMTIIHMGSEDKNEQVSLVQEGNDWRINPE